MKTIITKSLIVINKFDSEENLRMREDELKGRMIKAWKEVDDAIPRSNGKTLWGEKMITDTGAEKMLERKVMKTIEMTRKNISLIVDISSMVKWMNVVVFVLEPIYVKFLNPWPPFDQLLRAEINEQRWNTILETTMESYL